MEVEFKWVKDVVSHSLIMNLDQIPRIGDLVEIHKIVEYPGGQQDRIDVYGRVEDVIWIYYVTISTVIVNLKMK